MMLLDRRLLPVFVELMLDSGARCSFGGLVSAEKEMARWRGAWGGIYWLRIPAREGDGAWRI